MPTTAKKLYKMKLSELKINEWDGTYESIAEYKDKKILLLHFVNMIRLKEEGKKNLSGASVPPQWIT
jgi:hypothetical protein